MNMRSTFESIRTVDFGDLPIVDRSRICTPYDQYVGYIDGDSGSRGYDVYEFAEGGLVAVLEV